MFGKFYGIYRSKEQGVVILIKRCIEGGYHNKEDFWGITVVTLSMASCDADRASPKEERLERPVTNKERDDRRSWERFRSGQICRLKTHRMKEEQTQNLVARLWCIPRVVRAHEDYPELQAILDEYHRPVVIQNGVLGELMLDKGYDALEGEIQRYGKGAHLSLEVDVESKPSWTRARNAAKRLVTDQETWDKAMWDSAAEDLTGLANNWLSQDEESARGLETTSITEEEFTQRTLLTRVSISPGGRFAAYYSDDNMF